MKVTGRGEATTRRGTSSIDRWFAAKMRGPPAGTLAAPSTRRRKNSVKAHPANVLAVDWNRPRLAVTTPPMRATVAGRVQTAPRPARRRRGGSGFGTRGQQEAPRPPAPRRSDPDGRGLYPVMGDAPPWGGAQIRIK